MNDLNIAAASFFLVPIAAIVLNNILPKRLAEKYYQLLTGAVSLYQIIAALYVFEAMDVKQLKSFDFTIIQNLNIGGAELFSIHAISLVFLLCIGLVAFVSVLIANKTIDTRKSAYVNLLMTLIIGMNGMVLVSDFFTLYVFMEVVGLSSFVLIAMFRSRKALEGSIKYLVMSEFATILILTGLAFIFMRTGSLAYKAIGSAMLEGATYSQKILTYAALVLLIAGFSIKAGAVPFHSWLPDAYQIADTSVSVLLGGIVSKIAGVYGLYVLTGMFGGVEAVSACLAVVGLLSIVVGALLAHEQTDFKRIIAYSSVSQTGYILLGLSAGNMIGLIGTLVYIFSHAVFKSTLFANAAAIGSQTGVLEVDELGGLQSKMPVTAVSSVVAFLSTAGIPPFAGFWGKLLIIIALWSPGTRVLSAAALCASILTAAYMLRLQKKVFFGKTPQHLQTVTEIGGSVKYAEILLTAVTGVVGVIFPLVLVYLHTKGFM